MPSYNIEGAQQLFRVTEVAELLDSTAARMRSIGTRGPAAAFFAIGAGGRTEPFWDLAGIEAWRPFLDRPRYERLPTPKSDVPPRFSDHKAVNVVAGLEMTRRLWARVVSPGKLEYWYSTPKGWYQSFNRGRDWQAVGVMVRPAGDYKAAPLAPPKGSEWVSIYRGAFALRERVEERIKAEA